LLKTHRESTPRTPHHLDSHIEVARFQLKKAGETLGEDMDIDRFLLDKNPSLQFSIDQRVRLKEDFIRNLMEMKKAILEAEDQLSQSRILYKNWALLNAGRIKN